ncbi:hypothetical cytosolic protein [Syntrophus aciditrophicus SB]|uniref:Hypothetical cytosolic protein n=1 Tax=Syntrophus aciditrophicus (strain SB) TaxID=56780 RepID=Q2LPQ9_SYNAS|nr:hypothetical cytosolic protein [Syntrophus aciditrophicus SB]
MMCIVSLVHSDENASLYLPAVLCQNSVKLPLNFNFSCFCISACSPFRSIEKRAFLKRKINFFKDSCVQENSRDYQ